MGIEYIEVVQLPVDDLTRATTFYHRVLETDPQAANEDVPGGAAIIELVGRGPDLYLQRAPAPYNRPDGLLVGLRVAPRTDLQELLTRIEDAGGVVTYRETVNPDLLVVGFDDPEGNHLELLVSR